MAFLDLFLDLLALGILEREESIPGDIDSIDGKKSVLKRNKLQRQVTISHSARWISKLYLRPVERVQESEVD